MSESEREREAERKAFSSMSGTLPKHDIRCFIDTLNCTYLTTRHTLFMAFLSLLERCRRENDWRESRKRKEDTDSNLCQPYKGHGYNVSRSKFTAPAKPGCDKD